MSASSGARVTKKSTEPDQNQTLELEAWGYLVLLVLVSG
jgi:hypothetical protein